MLRRVHLKKEPSLLHFTCRLSTSVEASQTSGSSGGRYCPDNTVLGTQSDPLCLRPPRLWYCRAVHVVRLAQAGVPGGLGLLDTDMCIDMRRGTCRQWRATDVIVSSGHRHAPACVQNVCRLSVRSVNVRWVILFLHSRSDKKNRSICVPVYYLMQVSQQLGR